MEVCEYSRSRSWPWAKVILHIKTKASFSQNSLGQFTKSCMKAFMYMEMKIYYHDAGHMATMFIYGNILAIWPPCSYMVIYNKGASQFEAKRICEAERKRKERKARAKEPSSDSAQSEFTCSICNRQFRAKIGLYSHQRTHKHT